MVLKSIIALLVGCMLVFLFPKLGGWVRGEEPLPLLVLGSIDFFPVHLGTVTGGPNHTHFQGQIESLATEVFQKLKGIRSSHS